MTNYPDAQRATPPAWTPEMIARRVGTYSG
jgi:hypothetical protein